MLKIVFTHNIIVAIMKVQYEKFGMYPNHYIGNCSVRCNEYEKSKQDFGSVNNSVNMSDVYGENIC